MDYESEQMNAEVDTRSGESFSSGEIKTLSDIRRYEKRTLACPGGCGMQLYLAEIPTHDCVRDLKEKVEVMDDNMVELESRVAEMVAMEAYYKDKLGSQETKIDEMTEEIKDLVLERSRRDEIFSSKETFYKEQTAALKEQVAKLEKRMHHVPRRPSNNDQENEDEDYSDVQRVEREWALRFDKLLAEKITLETLSQKREREYSQEIATMKQEVRALRDSLRLEREVMALEYDQATFEKLQMLIDQLEEFVKRKKDEEYGLEQDCYNNQTDEDYISEDMDELKHNNNNVIDKHGLPNSVGCIESQREIATGD